MALAPSSLEGKRVSKDSDLPPSIPQNRLAGRRVHQAFSADEQIADINLSKTGAAGAARLSQAGPKPGSE